MATPDQVTDPVASRLLRRLRDSGALSRAELASRLEVPRARLLSELDALLAAGLVCEAGPAASRGGRRSTLVELNRELRFAAVDLGARSIDVEITDGRLEPIVAHAEPADIRSGPKAVLQRVSEILAKFKAEGAYERLQAIGTGIGCGIYLGAPVGCGQPRSGCSRTAPRGGPPMRAVQWRDRTSRSAGATGPPPRSPQVCAGVAVAPGSPRTAPPGRPRGPRAADLSAQHGNLVTQRQHLRREAHRDGGSPCVYRVLARYKPHRPSPTPPRDQQSPHSQTGCGLSRKLSGRM
jgi:DNA-binding transcriptional ArsR family regulator